MKNGIVEEQSYRQIDFTAVNLPSLEFEFCQFDRCNLAGLDLSNFRFVDCTFQNCDLSNAKLQKATLNDIRFDGCKMLGLHFDECSEFLFTVSFSNCSLDYGSFYGRQLKKTSFANSSLKQVDFTDANLTDASFEGCDLLDAVFHNTTLDKADLRKAFHFSIDPEKNRLKKTRFDRSALAGLLTKYDLRID